MGRPMLQNGLQRPRGGRPVPSCFVLTVSIETLQYEYTRGGFKTRPYPGFRVAPPRESGDHAGLPGMTIELCNELLIQDTSLAL